MLREVASLSRESNSERHFHGELNRTGRMNSSALFDVLKVPLADGQVRARPGKWEWTRLRRDRLTLVGQNKVGNYAT
jgi:hypothetical protein